MVASGEIKQVGIAFLMRLQRLQPQEGRTIQLWCCVHDFAHRLPTVYPRGKQVLETMLSSSNSLGHTGMLIFDISLSQDWNINPGASLHITTLVHNLGHPPRHAYSVSLGPSRCIPQALSFKAFLPTPSTARWSSLYMHSCLHTWMPVSHNSSNVLPIMLRSVEPPSLSLLNLSQIRVELTRHTNPSTYTS